jgi:hypothetical protein
MLFSQRLLPVVLAYETYGVEIKPLLVPTTKRLPQRTIESTLPTPGTVWPGVTFQTPFGPSITATPFTTSRSVQPSIVVGLVSGVGVSFRRSFNVAPVEAVRCLRGHVLSDLANYRIVYLNTIGLLRVGRPSGR